MLIGDDMCSGLGNDGVQDLRIPPGVKPQLEVERHDMHPLRPLKARGQPT